MESVFLVVVFLLNGEWTMVTTFPPLPVPTMEFCLERALPSGNNILSQKENLPEYHVLCLETTIDNGDEALKAYIDKNLAEPA